MSSSATRKRSGVTATPASPGSSEQAKGAPTPPLAAPLPGDVQRMRALANANAIRLRRAAVKRGLGKEPNMAAAWHAAAGHIAHPERVLKAMRVAELLMACRHTGKTKTRQVLLSAGIGDTVTIEKLTGRQRDQLLWALDGGSAVGMPKSSGLPPRAPADVANAVYISLSEHE